MRYETGPPTWRARRDQRKRQISQARGLQRRVLRTHVDKLGFGGQILPKVYDCPDYEHRILFTFLKSC